MGQLTTLYLRCDRVSAATPMDQATAAFCAEVSGRLRELAFGGSVERLIALVVQRKVGSAPAHAGATAAM